MKVLIVYDSAFGNTSKVAQTIEAAVVGSCEVAIMLAGDVSNTALTEVDLLIVGSPTQGGRATQPVQALIKALPDLAGIKVAAFDTRYAPTDQGVGLRLVMKVIGFAAEKIASGLQAKGGQLVLSPGGFIVGGKEGPLKDAELQRATTWAQDVLAAAKS